MHITVSHENGLGQTNTLWSTWANIICIADGNSQCISTAV